MVVLVVVSITVAIAGALIATSQTNVRHVRDVESTLVADYLAEAAVNMAYAEVASDVDTDGDGLGALGVNTPVSIPSSSGAPLGEVRCFVQRIGDNNVLTALAAIPSFAQPDTLTAVQAVIVGEQPFPLAPRPGAVAIAGGLQNPIFPQLGQHSLTIDGGADAALNLSELSGYTAIMEQIGDAIADGDIDGSEFTGGETSTYSHSTAGELTLPIVNGGDAFLASADLDAYRTSLRDTALSLADSADNVISSPVFGDQTWGTSSNPQITVIEAGTIGADRVFDTTDQTITGHGTLVIKHTVQPLKDLNLNWTGDIYVIGYNGDGDDLFRPDDMTATVNGNFVLLSDSGSEASLELMGTSNLTVNGSLLTLAESGSHESEVEMEDSSSLTVNGILGMFGSRIELEVSGSNASLAVNGALAVGTADDRSRSDDFEFRMGGAVALRYDSELVNSAVTGLTGLPVSAENPAATSTGFESFRITGVGNSISGHDALNTFTELVGSGEDIGVDFDSSD